MKKKNVISMLLATALLMSSMGQEAVYAISDVEELALEEECVTGAEWVSVIIEVNDAVSLDKVEKNVEKLIGEEFAVEEEYQVLLQGFATRLPLTVLASVKKMAGVKQVFINQEYETASLEITEKMYQTALLGGVDAYSDYTGKGLKVAFIDTGIDVNHSCFGPLSEEALTEDSMTIAGVEEALPLLNAAEAFSNLTAEQVYVNSKIAFTFDYADKKPMVDELPMDDAFDINQIHGTSVASVAAANYTDMGEYLGDIVGVARDAQIYSMDVFGQSDKTKASLIIAALEDAIVLGADVVNMSIGGMNGFSHDDVMDEVFEKATEYGIIFNAAAGNYGSYGNGSLENPDVCNMTWPGSYEATLAVGSVNLPVQEGLCLALDGTKYIYQLPFVNGEDFESGLVAPTFAMDLAGEELEVVTAYSDLDENIDCDGKLLMVRYNPAGMDEIYQKAVAMGAKGFIVADLLDCGDMVEVTYSDTMIPLASVSSYVALLLEKAESDGKKISFVAGWSEGISAEAMSVSDFSSWGGTPDLRIGLDYVAPGGNVYMSASDNQTIRAGGTSVASGWATGITLLALERVRKEYPSLTKAEQKKLATSLIMSNATPFAMVSPRQQGSGLASVAGALSSNAYVEVSGNERPVVELGSDVEKEGNYEFSYSIVNIGDKASHYEISTSVMTEVINEVGLLDHKGAVLNASVSNSVGKLLYDYNEDGFFDMRDARILRNALKGEIDAEAVFRYDLNKDGNADMKDVQLYLDGIVGKADVNFAASYITVLPGQAEEVLISVTVSEDGKKYLEQFENGSFVEGYSMAKGLDSYTSDLSVPYMAFYGDWYCASAVDTNAGAALYTYNAKGERVSLEVDGVYAISPNGDGVKEGIEAVQYTRVRNQEGVSILYTDAEDNYLGMGVLGNVARGNDVIPVMDQLVDLSELSNNEMFYAYVGDTKKEIVVDLENPTVSSLRVVETTPDKNGYERSNVYLSCDDNVGIEKALIYYVSSESGKNVYSTITFGGRGADDLYTKAVAVKTKQLSRIEVIDVAGNVTVYVPNP